MKKEVPKKKLAVFLVLSVLLITFTFYFYQVFFTPNILVDKTDRLVVIRANTGFRDLQRQFGDQQVINDMVSFSFVARVMGYDRKIKPGRYLLRANMSNREAVKALSAGRREAVKITFTHVRLLDDLKERITANIGVSPEEFEGALEDFIDSGDKGFTTETALCMFIPNTYEVYFNITPEELVNRMHQEYLKFWSADRLRKAEEMGLTPVQVSILASATRGRLPLTPSFRLAYFPSRARCRRECTGACSTVVTITNPGPGVSTDETGPHARQSEPAVP
mgnify:CR=1 FL=1